MEVENVAHPSTANGGVLQMGLAARGSLRWVAADISSPVEHVRRRLDLSPVAAAALGRSLAAAAMLLRLTAKTPQRLLLEARGDGPLRSILAEAREAGDLRGLVGEPRTSVPDYPDHKLAVGVALGQGHLGVRKEFAGGRSYQSRVQLVNGEIGLDVAHYLAQSEQTRSAVLLGVLTRREGVVAAGGLIVEVLPGADEEAIARLEQNVTRCDGVSRILDHGGVAAVRELLLEGLEATRREERSLRYHCPCSRERFLHHLVLLSPEDREYLREEDHTIHTTCSFCGAQYSFAPDELDPSPSVS